jgi:hypothetical protein
MSSSKHHAGSEICRAKGPKYKKLRAQNKRYLIETKRNNKNIK